MKEYMELRCKLDLIPVTVALDVMTRINDWLVSGGTIEDEYIKNQIEYANNFIK